MIGGPAVADLRTIFHVDMDAFFASVEIRDDPSLRGKPVLVGGVARRGVVAAASYEARKFGCHSAQPMAVALRMCPHAVVLPGRFEAYTEASDRAFEVFEQFSPVVEGLSIDEAFLDMTGTTRLFGPPREAAEKLRAAVREATRGLTCSVGISAVKFLAKIASGHRKPDGLTEIARGAELAFLRPLPIEDLWGVGPKTAGRLRAHGITTIADLERLGRSTLEGWFGSSGVHLHQLANAQDPREVVPSRDRKQISHEDTYAVDVVGEAAIRRKLLSQATRVADRLVAKSVVAQRVQLKIRDTAFRTETRQCTLRPGTDDARLIYRAVCDLLAAVELEGRSFRLTGVGAGDLVPRAIEGAQLELLPPEPNARGIVEPLRLQGVLSAVRTRFGHRALFPAEAGGDTRPDSAGGLSDTREDD
jgi:DNA polymerase IV